MRCSEKLVEVASAVQQTGSPCRRRSGGPRVVVCTRFDCRQTTRLSRRRHCCAMKGWKAGPAARWGACACCSFAQAVPEEQLRRCCYDVRKWSCGDPVRRCRQLQDCGCLHGGRSSGDPQLAAAGVPGCWERSWCMPQGQLPPLARVVQQLDARSPFEHEFRRGAACAPELQHPAASDTWTCDVPVCAALLLRP